MFRNKLLIAFSVLGVTAIVQAIITIYILSIANENVQRGRVANELYAGFVELLSKKHQLRLEITNALVGINSDPRQRDIFYNQMLFTLDSLDALAADAYALNSSDDTKLPELRERERDLQLLRKGVLQVGKILDENTTDKTELSLQDKRLLLTDLFDIADAKDLRAVLMQSITRERLATERDRATADVSLRFMNKIIMMASAIVIIFVLVLAYYFYLALSHPLDKLMQGTLALTKGDLGHRMDEAGQDEFAHLAKSLNRMAAEAMRLRNKDEQVRANLEFQVRERTRDFEETLHRLEKVDLRRKQMFADISHELRTPTTAIRGEAEITLRYHTSEIDDYRTTLQKIVNYTQALSRVIDDMLTLARSDIDAFVLERRAIAIDEVCVAAVEHCRAAAVSNTRELTVGNFPRAQVLGDSQRLEQVLRIGLDNAIQYTMASGKIEIEARLTSEADDGAHYHITIRNDGQSVPEHELSRVFDRHFRGENAKSIRPDGSGLGLPLARTIIHAHGGTIHLTSTEGGDTTLVIVLPLLETLSDTKS